MKYLPDANIFIKAAKGDLVESNFLNTAIKKKQIVISAVVIAEFLVKADKTEEKTFKNLLSLIYRVNAKTKPSLTEDE